MNKVVIATCAGLLGTAYVSSAAAFDAISTIPFALGSGKPNIDARMRYEGVNQASIDEPADAFTLRTRLGYTSGKWNAIDGQIEFENVTAIGEDHFNSTGNGSTKYPVVPDPAGSEINQAWVRYTGLPDTAIKFGRQRIIYDNARFVGNVGWRQNEQTYDGLTLTSTWIPEVTFNYAYLTNISAFKYNVINGSNTKNIDLDSTHLINLAYAPSKAFSLTGYGYLLNFAYNAPLPPATSATLNDPRRDTVTYGARAAGGIPFGEIKFSYALEYAHQSDFGDSPSTIDASYYLVETGAAYRMLNGKIGYEVLGGDGHYGFQTPLATLHAFQGWADQFLTTPAAGVQDFYVTLGGKVEKIALTAVWHDFNPDDSSAKHYGTEIDLQATRPVGKNFTVGAKYAQYSASNFPVDTKKSPYDTAKYWFWLEYKL